MPKRLNITLDAQNDAQNGSVAFLRNRYVIAEPNWIKAITLNAYWPNLVAMLGYRLGPCWQGVYGLIRTPLPLWRQA